MSGGSKGRVFQQHSLARARTGFFTLRAAVHAITNEPSLAPTPGRTRGCSGSNGSANVALTDCAMTTGAAVPPEKSENTIGSRTL